MQYVVYGVLALIVVILTALFVANFSKFVAFLGSLRTFYYEVRAEMKRVSWPTRDEVISSTLLVGVATVVLTVLVGGVDSVLGAVVGIFFSGE